MIFSSIKYFISPTYSVERQDELSKFLDANGASRANIEEASHIITNTLQFEGEPMAQEEARTVTVCGSLNASRTTSKSRAIGRVGNTERSSWEAARVSAARGFL